MSETPAQPGPAAAQTTDPKNGSLGAGIALAWACLIAGYFVVGALSSVVFSVLNGANSGSGAMLAILLFLLPWAAMIWLIVHFRKTNQPRTALAIVSLADGPTVVEFGAVLGSVVPYFASTGVISNVLTATFAIVPPTSCSLTVQFNLQ